MRIFFCEVDENSAGVRDWINQNYHEVKLLNPSFPMKMRTAMETPPAVLTEFRFREDDVVNHLISSGALEHDPVRVAAAESYLNTDRNALMQGRFAWPKFDPERPFIDEEDPDWRRADPERFEALRPYLEVRDAEKAALRALHDGQEWDASVNALYAQQRVDLRPGCTPEDVTKAVRGLMKIGADGYGTDLIEYERPENITDYYPGAPEL